MHDKVYQKGGLYKKWNDLTYSSAIHRAVLLALLLSLLFFSGVQNTVPYAIDYIKTRTALIQNQLQKNNAKKVETSSDREITMYISNARVEGVSTEAASVRWNTSLPEVSAVEYRRKNDPDIVKIVDGGEETRTRHDVAIDNLEINTTYEARPYIGSNLAPKVNPWMEFTTKTLEIESIREKITSKSIRIEWETSEASESSVKYRKIGEKDTKTQTEDVTKKEHVFMLYGLSADSEYEVTAISMIGKDLRVEKTRNYKTPSTDNDIFEGDGSAEQLMEKDGTVAMKLTWETKPQLTSVVYYRLNNSVEELKIEESKPVTRHNLVIRNLPLGSTITYAFSGRDSEGLEYRSQERSSPIIKAIELLDVRTENIKDNGFDVDFKSNVATDYTLRVFDGSREVAKYGSSNYEINRRVKVSELFPSIKYKIELVVSDSNGHKSQPMSLEVTTLKKGGSLEIITHNHDLLPLENTWAAVVSWRTSKLATTELLYGNNPDKLDHKAEVADTSQGSTKIQNIQYGSDLYIKIVSRAADGSIAKTEPQYIKSPVKLTFWGRLAASVKIALNWLWRI